MSLKNTTKKEKKPQSQSKKERRISKHSQDGELHPEKSLKTSLKKIGVGLQENSKRETLIFGKNMKESFGKNTMPE